MITFSLNSDKDNLDVSLSGDLDIDSTEVVEEELIPAMKNYKVVSVNFENVLFVDSSGIGLLLNLVQTLNENGTQVTISNVKEEVMEVFHLLQIPDILGEHVFV